MPQPPTIAISDGIRVCHALTGTNHLEKNTSMSINVNHFTQQWLDHSCRYHWISHNSQTCWLSKTMLSLFTMLHGQLMLRRQAQHFLDRGVLGHQHVDSELWWILLMNFVDFGMISASILKHKIVIDDPKPIQNLNTCAHGKKIWKGITNANKSRWGEDPTKMVMCSELVCFYFKRTCSSIGKSSFTSNKVPS